MYKMIERKKASIKLYESTSRNTLILGHETSADSFPMLSCGEMNYLRSNRAVAAVFYYF
jgi:hypothetical protein